MQNFHAPKLSRFEALIVVSFGGPNAPEDVVPFLRNVTRGRNVPEKRLKEVARQYAATGGRSPINAQCEALIAAIRADLAKNGIDLPVYWGNRNWHPYLTDSVQQMHDDGIRRAAAFVTSAYSSYSGCRQYREDIAAACNALDDPTLSITKLRPYYTHAGFLFPFIDNVRACIDAIPQECHATTCVIFVAHSLPMASARSCAYVEQLHEVAVTISREAQCARVGAIPFTQLLGNAPPVLDDGVLLAFQSRSGSPQTPWLEPDISEALRFVAKAGYSDVIVVPIGFVSDHQEVVYDLDILAATTAHDIGVTLHRVSTPGTDHRFVQMVRELLLEADAMPDYTGCRSTDCCPPPQPTSSKPGSPEPTSPMSAMD